MGENDTRGFDFDTCDRFLMTSKDDGGFSSLVSLGVEITFRSVICAWMGTDSNAVDEAQASRPIDHPCDCLSPDFFSYHWKLKCATDNNRSTVVSGLSANSQSTRTA